MACTQYGAKLRSSWMISAAGSMILAAVPQCIYGDSDQSQQTIFADWMFESAAVAQSASPDPATFSSAAPAVTLTLGAVSVSPGAATFASSAPAITLTLGAVAVAPGAAAFSASAPSVTISFGSQAVSPAAAVATFTAPAITLYQGTSARSTFPPISDAATVPPVSGDYAVEWTPVGGVTNYECVLLNNDAKYIYSGIPLDTDLYNMTPLPSSATGVSSVGVRFIAKHNHTGGTFKVRPACRLGADLSYGSEVAVDVTYQLYIVTGIACPDGGLWTPAKLNAAQLGLQTTVLVGGKAIFAQQFSGHHTWSETLPTITHADGAQVSLVAKSGAQLVTVDKEAAHVSLVAKAQVDFVA